MVEATVELLQSYLRGDAMPNTQNIVIAGQLVLRGSCQNRHQESAT